MTLPALITVKGIVQDAGGPIAGRFVFARDTALFPASTSDQSYPIPEEIETVVGADGTFAQPLYATNDPAASPTGWTWEVRTHFPGWRTTFNITVPYDAAGGQINLNQLAPVPANGTGALYALANHTHSGGGGGAVDSVFGRTGAVVAQTGDYTKTNVGLGNVDNTSDAGKPVSTAQLAALNLKADLAGPTFTGTPAAPTAAAGTSTTQLATTAFVAAAAIKPTRFDLSHWGFKAASDDPLNFMSQSQVNNQIWHTRVWVAAGVPITNLYLALTQAGTHDGVTNGNQIGLYDDAGNLVDSIAANNALWSTAGWRGGALQGGTIAAQAAGRFVYCAAMVRGYGTLNPSLAFPSSPGDFAFQYTGPGTTKRRTFYTSTTGTFPSTIDPTATGTATGYVPLFGIS